MNNEELRRIERKAVNQLLLNGIEAIRPEQEFSVQLFSSVPNVQLTREEILINVFI